MYVCPVRVHNLEIEKKHLKKQNMCERFLGKSLCYLHTFVWLGGATAACQTCNLEAAGSTPGRCTAS